MSLKSKLLIAGAAGTIGLIAAGGVVMADNTTPGSSLVEKIASTFHLNKADVQKVFDEDRAQHQADHEAKYEARLDQAVKDGKLTADQKTKILAKHKELESQMQANRDSMKDKTPEERKAAMDAERTAIEQWEKDNNIPAGYLGFGPHGGGMRGGFGHGEGGPR